VVTGSRAIAVKGLLLSSPVAGDFILNIGGTGTAIGAPSQGYNKLCSGANSGAGLAAGIAAPAALLSAGELSGARVIGGRIALQASAPIQIALREPIVITAGYALCVLGTVANRQVNATFEWEEV
jgi:hypothetical protein